MDGCPEKTLSIVNDCTNGRHLGEERAKLRGLRDTHQPAEAVANLLQSISGLSALGQFQVLKKLDLLKLDALTK